MEMNFNHETDSLTDEHGSVYTLDEAMEKFQNGEITTCNLYFQRLIQLDFNIIKFKVQGYVLSE